MNTITLQTKFKQIYKLILQNKSKKQFDTLNL